MKILPSGNWSQHWPDYKNRGPATTYYRKIDVARALALYDYTIDDLLPDGAAPWPGGEDFVTVHIEPFRVVYDN